MSSLPDSRPPARGRLPLPEVRGIPYHRLANSSLKALSIFPEPNPEELEHLGDAEWALGNREAVMGAWNRALAQNHTDRVRKNLER
jgi:hypothetical protein